MNVMILEFYASNLIVMNLRSLIFVRLKLTQIYTDFISWIDWGQQHEPVYFLIKVIFATASYFKLKLSVFEGVSYVDIGLTKNLKTEESLYLFINSLDNFSNNLFYQKNTYFRFYPVLALTYTKPSAFIDLL